MAAHRLRLAGRRPAGLALLAEGVRVVWLPLLRRLRGGQQLSRRQSIRIVLDMFDQVRRDYRIDPERTYITGFSGGGRVSCTIGFSLPEFFAGVIPVCGTNPLNSLDYLRHRVKDRASVAFVTGETDFNRAENEKYMSPFLTQLGIRSKLWVVPKLGHGVPGEAVLKEVVHWLEDDLHRRRDDVKQRPALAVPADDKLIASARRPGCWKRRKAI